MKVRLILCQHLIEDEACGSPARLRVDGQLEVCPIHAMYWERRGRRCLAIHPRDKGPRPASASALAVVDVIERGLTISAAAEAHGINRATVHYAVKIARLKKAK